MEAVTFIDEKWVEGNPGVLGPLTHATWLGSIVFDGARVFENLVPDLDLHCERVIRSARMLNLKPMVGANVMVDLSLEGARRFPKHSELYIRPVYFAENGNGLLIPDPESTRFMLTVHVMDMPPDTGFSSCLSQFCRPNPNAAPSLAKAVCHYPNLARARTEAVRRGFDNAVVLDGLGHVAEFASSNLFFVRDGCCITPADNGTFLNGVTRQRVIQLFCEDGIFVEERSVMPDELLEADEIFSTGNYGKVVHVNRYEHHTLEPGPFYCRARELYWGYSQRFPL